MSEKTSCRCGVDVLANCNARREGCGEVVCSGRGFWSAVGSYYSYREAHLRIVGSEYCDGLTRILADENKLVELGNSGESGSIGFGVSAGVKCPGLPGCSGGRIGGHRGGIYCREEAFHRLEIANEDTKVSGNGHGGDLGTVAEHDDDGSRERKSASGFTLRTEVFEANEKSKAESGGSRVGEKVTVDSDSSRGPNWERNRLSKEKKKIKKQKRQSMGVDWRERGSISDSSYRKGYFAECPKEVQDSLRESRAAMLVARNKKDQAEYEKRAKQLSSTEEAVRSILSALRLSEQLKSIKDAKVGGWVETVADTMVKSVAESVPDSVPSLESVGYGKSALKSSDGSGSGASIERKVEYEVRMRDLESYYDDLGAYSAEDYDNDVKRLKTTYADVTGISASLKTSDLIAGCLKKGMSYAESIAFAEELGMCEFE